MSFSKKVKQLILGHPLNPLNPQILRHVSLVAFLAWVGLGADGLSSSCYGPEEAYIALGPHTQFALYIAIATAITVFVISLGYNQVIELFPSGGGGYKVASQLLGSHIGLISGAALIVDYVLTIAVSTASAMDAVFSLLPTHLLSYKLLAEAGLILVLILLNMRGMKESIKFLLPIFLGFFIIHVVLIVYGIIAHRTGLSLIIPSTIEETRSTIAEVGWIPVLALILHAYSLGSGTYTGLEAVSNNVNRLREPRVVTGKWTMFYMATSLSMIAGGIILLYLLWAPTPHMGQTLNAVVFHSILGDSEIGKILLFITLLLEAGLLVLAANTGFLAGPSVLANMAIDGWMPNRFRHLSTRLVIQNGLILFGIFALAILIWCRGKVSLLVVLYSINVFLTFSLSLFGLCVYWARQKSRASSRWLWRLLFSFLAFSITSSILCITVFSKFQSGGWLTVVVTCTVILVCLLVKRHYRLFNKKLAQLDVQLKQPIVHPLSFVTIDPQQPTAVILVGKSPGVAMHTLLNVIRMFPRHFKNFVFMSAGIVDVESFAGQSELEKMRNQVNENLQYFIDYCNQYGIAAEGYAAFGTDTVEELVKLAEEISQKYSNCIFFSSKLIFEKDNWLMRLLHNETPLTLQRNLHLQGKELVILPMKI
ncbi:APC family permease [Aquicella lusitana]|uniref:Amino acid/polyamine/organocation transporter (APC superfamily) n=1 Tax=Aquicella lusitana TaxID=254246 RepID=A0A370GKK1_9COXI|nr:APC family permease [Aquicella lusitana]RDI43756.1 amino acid/polyamine/organocation transporter (APC superfamily) [Aquicella lusitana]VVC74513.1 Low affinity potassium transport system protein kup [Aquicella lusitana]